MTLKQLLDLDQGEASALLSGLHSILDIPNMQTENITILHASFSEFLLDSNRAGVYYVGTKFTEQERIELIYTHCIQTLSQYCVDVNGHSTHSHDFAMNSTTNIALDGLSNVWWYLHRRIDSSEVMIGKKVVAALNGFDPHLFLTILLQW